MSLTAEVIYYILLFSQEKGKWELIFRMTFERLSDIISKNRRRDFYKFTTK